MRRARAMSLPEPDPRVFFAAERTLLAWLRSGLTIIGIGFVVARFGLFLALLSAQRQVASIQAQSHPSAALGVLFVIAGAMAILLATIQHRRFVSTLPKRDLPPSYSQSLAVALCFLVGIFGLLLAVYLVVSQP